MIDEGNIAMFRILFYNPIRKPKSQLLQRSSKSKIQMTNQAQNRKEKTYDLEERTAIFSEEVVVFLRTIRRDVVNIPIISQLVRSVTSIGANYCEADGAESKKDFQHKIAICKKECKESKYWFRVLSTANPERADECRKFWKEAHELTLIFSKIISNSKEKK
jgi:four helix bundle protein